MSLLHHLIQQAAMTISPSHLLLTLFFLPLYILLRRATNSNSKKRSYSNLPPSPPKLPIIGNLHQLGPLPHRSLRSFSDRLGPLMLLRLGNIHVLVASSPSMAEAIMKTQDHVFANRPSLRLPRQLFYNCRDIAFAPYGDYWRHVKKISALHLLSSRRVSSYRSIREEETARMLDEISRSTSLSGSAAVNVSRSLNLLAKDVIGRVALGKSTREEEWGGIIHVLIEEGSSLLGAFHVGDYFPWLGWLGGLGGLDATARRISQKVDEILEQVVNSHIARLKNGTGHPAREEDHEDFVDVLLSLEEELNMQFCFNRENIKAILMTLQQILISHPFKDIEMNHSYPSHRITSYEFESRLDIVGAGTDASHIVMEWTMAELAQNPKAMNKLQQEVRTISGSKPMIKEEELANMSYLKAVIKETLRLHPPGPLLAPRESMEETEIQGYFIPKNTMALVNVWAIGRDPKVWEDPEEFRPERFEGRELDFKGRDFELTPCGAGRRACPGIQFAVSIVELAIANLVRRFDWDVPEGELLDMGEAPGLTARKRIGLRLVATPRSV